MTEFEEMKELFEERAGIMQHDGGLSKEKAEQRALDEILDHFITKNSLAMNKAETYHKINKLKNFLKK